MSALASVADVASQLGVSDAVIYRRVAIGALPAVRLGSRIRLDPQLAEQLVVVVRLRPEERSRRAFAAAREWREYASARGPTAAAIRAGRPIGRTRDRLARIFGVDKRAIQDARALLTRAPDLAARVQRGDMSLKHARGALREREGAA